MKNSLSKTLLCGILASSFLLVNCQKAPSRGVKAKPGAGGSPSDSAKLAADELKKLTTTDCSPEFIAAYTTTYNQQNKLQMRLKEIEVKKETLDDAAKTDLDKQIEDLTKSSAATAAEALKLKTESCQIVDAKDKNKKSDKIPFARFDKKSLELGDAVSKLTGKENELSKKAAVVETKKAEQGFIAGKELIVSRELGESLDQAQKDGVSYFSNGNLTTTNFKLAQEDKSNSVCYITMTAGKLAEGSKLTIIDAKQGVDSVTKRKNLIVTLQSSEGLNAITCLIADGKEATAKQEFKKALGSNITSASKTDRAGEASSEDKEVKKDAAAKAAEKATETGSDKTPEKKSEVAPASAKPATNTTSTTDAVSQTGVTDKAAAEAAAKKAQAETAANNAASGSPQAASTEQAAPTDPEAAVASAQPASKAEAAAASTSLTDANGTGKQKVGQNQLTIQQLEKISEENANKGFIAKTYDKGVALVKSLFN